MSEDAQRIVMTDADIAAQLRKLLNAYPLAKMDWPLDVMRSAAEALDRRPPGVETEGVEAARKVVAVMKSIAGKRLAIKFPDDETALQIATIVENAGKVARALLSTSSRGETDGSSLAMTPASLPASDGRPSIERLRDMLNKTSVWLLADGKHPINRSDLLRMIEETLSATKQEDD